MECIHGLIAVLTPPCSEPPKLETCFSSHVVPASTTQFNATSVSVERPRRISPAALKKEKNTKEKANSNRSTGPDEAVCDSYILISLSTRLQVNKYLGNRESCRGGY